MGLDVTAYSKCRFVAPQVGDDWDEHYELGHVYVNNDDGFMDRLDGLSPGWYVSDGESLDLRAGSYSGYNRWREQLCRLALGVEPVEVWKEPENFTGRPFVELVNFTDCDGTIGPVTAAKLLADFEAAEAVSVNLEGDYFAAKCAEWTRAFRLASDGGLVRFH